MTRKEFLAQLGTGAAALLLPACLGGCKKNNTTTPQNSPVDFTIDTSTGALSVNGGFLIQNNVIVARTNTGSFIAVSASCTHAGSAVQYSSGSNSFFCPSHGATFSSTGAVTQGPASTNLTSYNTTLTGHSLRVFS
jgi:cytochrome b6-f complex iron-sulfur subunit